MPSQAAHGLACEPSVGQRIYLARVDTNGLQIITKRTTGHLEASSRHDRRLVEVASSQARRGLLHEDNGHHLVQRSAIPQAALDCVTAQAGPTAAKSLLATQ